MGGGPAPIAFYASGLGSESVSLRFRPARRSMREPRAAGNRAGSHGFLRQRSDPATSVSVATLDVCLELNPSLVTFTGQTRACSSAVTPIVPAGVSQCWCRLLACRGGERWDARPQTTKQGTCRAQQTHGATSPRTDGGLNGFSTPSSPGTLVTECCARTTERSATRPESRFWRSGRRCDDRALRWRTAYLD